MLPSSISAASQQPPSSLSATSQQLPNSIPQSTTNDTTHLAQACMCKCICECMCDCTCERIGVNIGGQPCVWRWYAGLASVCLQAPCSIHRSLQEIQIAATRSVQAEEGQSTYRHHVCNAAAVLPLAELPSWPWLGVSGGQCTSPAENIAVSYHLAVRIVPFHPHKDMLRKCVLRTPQALRALAFCPCILPTGSWKNS